MNILGHLIVAIMSLQSSFFTSPIRNLQLAVGICENQIRRDSAQNNEAAANAILINLEQALTQVKEDRISEHLLPWSPATLNPIVPSSFIFSFFVFGTEVLQEGLAGNSSELKDPTSRERR